MTDGNAGVSPQILVVDDTPASLKLLTGILSDKGYHVRPASSGRLALRSAGVAMPDLVLLDVMMPDMDGYEVCRQLKARENTRGVPVIFLSSLDQPLDKVKGFLAGGVDFITKPFQPEEVLARVGTHLALHQLRIQLESQNARLEEEIIERQQKEEELQKYQAHLEDLVSERTENLRAINRELEFRNIILLTQQESSIDGILIVDDNGNIVSVNQRFRDIFGIPKSTELSRFDDLFSEFLEKHLAGSESCREKIRNRSHYTDEIHEDECILPDDRIIEIYSSPMIDAGRTFLGRVWLFRDISRRRKMENLLAEKTEELDKFFSLNLDLLCIASNDGYFLRLNPEWEQALGYTAEELMARPYLDFIHPDDLVETRKVAAISMRDHVSRFTNRYRHKDGTYRWIEWSSIPYRDRIYASARDITNRKFIENSLSSARKKLNLLNSVVFSDIQNYVFALSGYIGLQTEAGAGEQPADLGAKEQKMLAKITNSLYFAKLYQDMGISPPGWHDVNQTFLYAISHLDFSGFLRNIDLDGLEIFADPLLEKVFLSLAENVIRHGKTATRVSLTCRQIPAGLVLVFEDNGAGIPVDVKEAVFEQWFGEEKGMGLFLSREILAITGLSIKETGTPGEGARFEILVPEGSYRFSRK